MDRNVYRMKQEGRQDQTERNRAARAKNKARKASGQYRNEWTRVGDPRAVITTPREWIYKGW